MLQSTLTLSQLIIKAKSYLAQHNYADSTIARYQHTWNYLSKYYAKNGITAYSYEICRDIIMRKYNSNDVEKDSSYRTFQIRCLKVLDAIANDIPLPKCCRETAVMTDSSFASIWNTFLANLDLNSKTIRGKGIQLTRFLNFIACNGYNDIAQIDEPIILAYVASLKSDGYASSTRTGILFTLRQFLRFLYNQGYTEKPLHDLYPIIVSKKHDVLPSLYSEEEVSAILNNVDRDNPIGRRDYLILLMAVQLGIRAGDIRTMTLDRFHWDKNTIEFSQQKTGNPIQLPLTDEIRYALIDYLKNSRPATDSPFIFVRTRAPYEPYSSTNVFHYVISHHINATGIEFGKRHHGLHSMRHSLASNLLNNNTPYPVITGILGHENTNTTRVYLSIDIEQLRTVALEVPYEE